MSLNTSRLATAMKTQIEAQFGAPSDATALQQFCTAMATAIVNEIQGNLQAAVNTADLTALPGTFTSGTNPVTGSTNQISGTLPAGRFS